MGRSGPVTKETSSIALGMAQIRLGVSSSYIATVTPALAAADSIGAMASTAFKSAVDYFKQESGFPLQEDIVIPIRESCQVECGFKEITSKNLAIARGIDPFGAISAAAVELFKNSTAGTAGTVGVDNAGGVVSDTWTLVVEAVATDITYSVYGNANGKVLDSVTDAADRAPDNGGNPFFTIPDTFFGGTWAVDDTYVFATTAYHAAGSAYTDPHAGTISLGTLAAPAYLRAELVYTFPNGTNTMTILLPRVNATSNLELGLQAEDASVVNLVLEAKNASSDVNGGNANWDSAPLGKIIFA